MPNASLLRSLRLAALAVGERARLRACRAAAAISSAAAALRPSKAASTVAAVTLALPAAFAAFLRKPRGVLCAAAFLCFVLPFLVVMAQTEPSGPLLPLGATADRFFMGQLAGSMFLDPSPDFSAGRCSDGYVVRAGTRADCGAYEPIADARDLLADAVAFRRGDSLAGLASARAAAARDLSAQMEKWRVWTALMDAAAVAAGSAIVLVTLYGLAFWTMVLMSYVPKLKPLSAALLPRLVGPLGQQPAQLLASPRMMLSMVGAMFSFCLVGSMLCGLATVAVFRVAPESFAGDVSFALLAGHAYADRHGSEMVLVEAPSRPSWQTPPNDYWIASADVAERGRVALPLGSWTPLEMFSAQAPRLLSERAPALTPEQRAGALFSFGLLRDRVSNAAMAGAFPGLLVFLFVIFLWLVSWGAFCALRGLLRSGRGAIDRLADEGAQIPLARRERGALLDAVEGSGDSDNPAERPRRDPPRL
jgi:hypothetical protein